MVGGSIRVVVGRGHPGRRKGSGLDGECGGRMGRKEAVSGGRGGADW